MVGNVKMKVKNEDKKDKEKERWWTNKMQGVSSMNGPNEVKNEMVVETCKVIMLLQTKDEKMVVENLYNIQTRQKIMPPFINKK